MHDAPPTVVHRFDGDRASVDPAELEGSSARSDETTDPVAPGSLRVVELWATGDHDLAPGLGGLPHEFRSRCAQGGTRARLVTMGAGREAPVHTTASLDYDLVVAGAVTLTLEAGSVALSAGDVVVLPNVAHGWRAGPDGCVLLVTMVDGETHGG